MTPAFQAGLHLYQIDRYEQAVTEFRRHLAQEPHHSQGHAFLGLALLEMEKLEEATEESRQAIELDPSDGFGYFVMGRAMLERNRIAEARRALQEAIQLDPEHADYHGFLGGVELRDSRWQAALDAADQGLQFDPEHSVCLNVRSTALVQLGRRAEAAQTMQEALRNDPENSWTHANQGWSELHSGRPKVALEHFREAMRLDPTNEWARAGIVESLKARNFIYRGMLAFFLWMTRLPAQWRWGVIAAIFFGPRLLRQAGEAMPQFAWLTEMAVQFILVFAVMTWIADPLFNMVLRFDRYGKYALSRDQIRSSNLMALFLFPALALWVTSWFVSDPYQQSLLMSAIALGVVVLPAGVLYSCDEGWPRTTMLLYLLALACAGVLSVVGWTIEGYCDLYYGGKMPAPLALAALPGLIVTLPLLYSPLATFVLAQWLVRAKVQH